MAIPLLASTINNYDLTTNPVVLNGINPSSNDVLVQVVLIVGSFSGALDPADGNFEISIFANGNSMQPYPQIYPVKAISLTSFYSIQFPLQVLKSVNVSLRSPNANDTNVSVAAYLYDVGPQAADLTQITSDIAAISADLALIKGATFNGSTDSLEEIRNSIDTLPTDSISATSLSDAAAQKIADTTIRRSFSNAANSVHGDPKSFRSPLGALGKLVNKVEVQAADLLIYEDDDTTVLGTQNLTSDPNADPITGVDTV